MTKPSLHITYAVLHITALTIKATASGLEGGKAKNSCRHLNQTQFAPSPDSTPMEPLRGSQKYA